MASESPIFLIGYMACGKTTLGRALQKAFPELVDFIDLDEYIVDREGRDIPRIFAESGEPYFRRLEADAIAELSAREQSSGKRKIVACGGGTPCQPGNMERMLDAGTVVWLQADMDRTISRLIDAQNSRPLVAGKSPEELAAFVSRNLEARTPHYSRAHHHFDTTHLDTLAEVDATVEKFAKLFLLQS